MPDWVVEPFRLVKRLYFAPNRIFSSFGSGLLPAVKMMCAPAGVPQPSASAAARNMVLNNFIEIALRGEPHYMQETCSNFIQAGSMAWSFTQIKVVKKVYTF